MTSYFREPWSRGLKATTGVLLLICALIALRAGPVGASIIVGVVLLSPLLLGSEAIASLMVSC